MTILSLSMASNVLNHAADKIKKDDHVITHKYNLVKGIAPNQVISTAEFIDMGHRRAPYYHGG